MGILRKAPSNVGFGGAFTIFIENARIPYPRGDDVDQGGCVDCDGSFARGLPSQ